MKTTLILSAAALVRLACALPQYQPSYLEELDDLEERDDECGAPEPVTTYTHHHWHHSTVTATPSAITTAAAEPSTTVPTVGPPSSAPASIVASSVVSSASSLPSTSSKSSGANPYVPSGLKAGLSGFIGIATNFADGFNDLAPHIGWYSDYSAVTPDAGDVVGVPMLWGDGKNCLSDTNNTGRLEDFKTSVAVSTPKLMFGFYEPDCDCPMSSDISDPTVGAQQWNDLIAPLAAKGTVLGSPSMCKQYDEDWLTPFKNSPINADWEITSIHVNKNSLNGVMADVEYYFSTYGKPLWISEFACVDDHDGFTPCSDQGEIDEFINQVVPWLQANESVVAYGPSNGEGLGDTWPLFSNGQLSATGQTYLNAIKNLNL